MTAPARRCRSVEIAELTGVAAGGNRALARLEAGDLRPDEGAVGHVVVQERRRRQVTGELGVPVGEPPGQVGGAEPLQVHGQAGGVVQAVEPAEPVIEVEAVEDPRPVVQAVDVVGEQIAVAVDDAPVADPGRAAAGRARRGTARASRSISARPSAASSRPAAAAVWREVVLPPAEQCVGAASRADLR